MNGPPQPYGYSLYGLRLESVLHFPELSPAEQTAGAPDVRLKLGKLSPERPQGLESNNWFLADERRAWLVWENFAAIRIEGGVEIEVDPHPSIDPLTIRPVVLGPVFSLLLLQRGFYPLHASCVVYGGKALAIAADTGAGKSTLAATLHERGGELAADDVTAIDVNADPPHAIPGCPQMKLWPQTAAHLGQDFADWPRVHALEDKRVRTIPSRFARSPLPLARVYLMEDGEREEFELLDQQSAFRELMRFGHRPSLLAASAGPIELARRCARIASAVPVFRFRRRRGLGLLDLAAEALERHAQA